MRVDLSVGGRTFAFEFAAHETRAITVGSLPQADVRIDRPGVAPVHFHIERNGDRVWIVPANGGCNIRVNAAKIRGPRVIAGKAILEFSDVRVLTRVVERRSRDGRESSPDTETLGWTTVGARDNTLATTRYHLPVPAPWQAVSPPSEEATLFDPISAPVSSSRSACSPQPGLSRLQMTKDPSQGIEAVGSVSGRWLRSAWFAGTLLVFVVSALIGAVSKHFRKAGHSHAQPTSSASALNAPLHGSPPELESVRERRSSTSPFEFVSIDPSWRTKPTKEESNTAHDLSEAAGHLIAARYADARRAYTALAIRFPTNPTYSVVSRVLTVTLDSRCSMDKSRFAVSCPEIKQ